MHGDLSAANILVFPGDSAEYTDGYRPPSPRARQLKCGENNEDSSICSQVCPSAYQYTHVKKKDACSIPSQQDEDGDEAHIVLIDLAAAVDVSHPSSQDRLSKGIERISKFFSEKGSRTLPQKIAMEYVTKDDDPTGTAEQHQENNGEDFALQLYSPDVLRFSDTWSHELICNSRTNQALSDQDVPINKKCGDRNDALDEKEERLKEANSKLRAVVEEIDDFKDQHRVTIKLLGRLQSLSLQIWAEKECRNLIRASYSGVYVASSIIQKESAFIHCMHGSGLPFQRLKDWKASKGSGAWTELYTQILVSLKR